MVTLILIALLITWIMSIVLYKKACRYYYDDTVEDDTDVIINRFSHLFSSFHIPSDGSLKRADNRFKD